MTHVFLCQRFLWQEEWRRRFEKEMDIWFMVHTGIFWSHSLLEPLLVGISFPMRKWNHPDAPYGPWLVRQQREEVAKIGLSLSKLSKSCHYLVSDYLRKLWVDP